MSATRTLRDRQFKGLHSTFGFRKFCSSELFLGSLEEVEELVGHSGCVNTLDWSPDGQYLASGSDDRKLIIWDSYATNYEMAKSISTGHKRNIFSVKFVPNTSNRTLITAAGDKTIRVFDVEYGAASSVVMEAPCSRNMFKNHHEGIRDLEVENDGHTFLSCSEDGDIRCFDLRQGRTDRAPLISYAKHSIDLFSISLSKINPYLLATGGSHSCAFLHDRRMIGRSLTDVWGIIPINSAAPTQCVKKFRLDDAPISSFKPAEGITSLKFSSKHARELVVSWSGDSVHLFDIHGDVQHGSTTMHQTPGQKVAPLTRAGRKRKRAGSPIENPLSNIDGLDCYDLLHAVRNYLLNPPFSGRDYLSAYHKFADASEVAQARTPLFHDKLFSSHMDACTDLLRALAGVNTWNRVPELRGSCLWECEAIAYIARAFSGGKHFLEESELFLPPDGRDYPIIDITGVTTDGHVLFKTITDMVRTYNHWFSLESASESGSGSRDFWLGVVCRFLLKSLNQSFMTLVRPEIVDTDSSSDDSDRSEYDDDYAYMARAHGADDVPSSAELGQGELSGGMPEVPEVPSRLDFAEVMRLYELRYPRGTVPSGSIYNSRESLYAEIYKVSPGVPVGLPFRSFKGAANVETVKDVNFFGLDDEYIMAGDDTGLAYIWEKATGKVVTILRADSETVNVMEGRPQDNTLAISGIDNTIKIFEFVEDTLENKSYRSTSRQYSCRKGNTIGRLGRRPRLGLLRHTTAAGTETL